MEEFRSSVHLTFREAMADRVLGLERSLGFTKMVPVGWHDWQIEGNREVANHPDLKKAVAGVGLRWENYLSDTWRESMTEIFGSNWKKDAVRLPRPEPEPPTAAGSQTPTAQGTPPPAQPRPRLLRSTSAVSAQRSQPAHTPPATGTSPDCWRRCFRSAGCRRPCCGGSTPTSPGGGRRSSARCSVSRAATSPSASRRS